MEQAVDPLEKYLSTACVSKMVSRGCWVQALLGAKIEYWGLVMVMGTINHAFLTMIALRWLKKEHSNPAGHCMPLGSGGQPWTWETTLKCGPSYSRTAYFKKYIYI